MKKIAVVLGILAAFGLQAQQKFTIEQTQFMEKKADSMACSAHRVLKGCFEKWDDNNFNQSLRLIKDAQGIYQELMKKGTAKTNEMAELQAMMIETKLKFTESSMMLFDDGFSRIMRDPESEKRVKRKYYGTVLLIPKSQDYKFDNIITKIGTFCD